MLQVIKRISTQSADFLGISASLLCLVHCLAFPVFISLGYLLEHADDHDHLHWHWMDYFFIVLAVWAVYNAAKNTQSFGIKIALWVSVSIFSISVSLHEWKEWMILISLASSFTLVIVHIINWKFHRKCKVITK